MPHFYPDLRDDTSVADLPHVLGVTKDLLFISHHESEVVDTELKSHSNPFEAEYCIKLANYFVQQGYRHDQITVLCTYLDQLLELRKLGKRMFGFDNSIRIENVDNYQGEECNIIILSLVRSNNPDNRIGFLNIPNRVCVALSRAQIGLYVVANFDFLADNCELWKNIKQSVQDVGSLSYGSLPVKCQMHGTEQSIESLEDFENKCPEGGCNQLCGARMDCGHTCWKPCHAYDLLHKDPCKKPCAKVCSSDLQHPCKKKCSEECGACLVLVDKTLPCGHSKRDACHLPVESVFCIQACKKVLPCGHPCKLKCGQDCSAQKCSFPVTRVLTGCGHNAQMACSTPPSDFKCVTIVEKKWPNCNHLVETVCSMDVENTPCPKPCKTELPDCGHLCMGTCGQCRNGRIHIQCKKDCKRILVCGHECGSKCSKVCPPCEQICQTACAHSQCSRVAIPGHGQQKKSRKGKKGKGGKEVGRICGDPCPPCAEPCLNQCEHRKCTEFCWRPCNVEPCNQPCQKLLPCSPKLNVKKEEKGCMDEDDDEQAEEQADAQHFCIGVCGENCPNICKICQPEEYALLREILFGREDEPDAKFIQLVDCGHILELSAVDDWIKSKFTTTEASDDGQTETMELVQINCPLCKTPIRRSKRYISLLNKRACDLEQAKAKHNWTVTGSPSRKSTASYLRSCDPNS
uniref:NF-X1-type domain-containing protein n=1 Tax=Ditylenchus dipsaci TaxID=166011 RepID=A0A915ELC3_9BILA